jgi:DNA-binding transcriptional MocR family regulator
MPLDDTLYGQIADSLARSIRAGTLRRGERLPSVRVLARERQVSLATATQAYRRLEDARLIEARPRSGYFVAARPSSLPEPQPSAPSARSVNVDRSALAAEVLRLAEDPEVVSFGAACPSGELFDVERLRRALSRAALRHRHTLGRYAQAPGHADLRRAIARAALHLGCELDPQNVLITNGCLESVTLCLRAVTQPGDIVALESPTYFGFLQILEQLGLRALEVPTHPRTGLSVDALRHAFDNHPVKAVACTPTLSNPIGASLPASERQRLAQLVGERGVPLIEDVIYNDLCEQDEARRAVRSYDRTGHVMLCGSVTKTVSPGLRLGWVDAGRWSAKVQRIKAVTSGGQSTVLELALADLLTQPGQEAHYRQLRQRVAQRVDEAREIIAASFPEGTRVTDPAGGFILWVELPEGSDSMAVFEASIAERIVIAPGSLFSPSDRFRHCLRLGVGGRWDAAQKAGLRRVGELATELLQRRSGAPRVPVFDLGSLP